MWITLLCVLFVLNALILFGERARRQRAEQRAERWKEEARKHYIHTEFLRALVPGAAAARAEQERRERIFLAEGYCKHGNHAWCHLCRNEERTKQLLN